jgi:catechol 2,3-dioxygenase-like lactoylglutathione lyase family enzyme
MGGEYRAAPPYHRGVRVRIDHVKLPVADLERTKAFYAAALEPLGYELVFEGPQSIGFGRDDFEPIAFQQTPSPSAGTHVALTAFDTASVDAFYAAAVDAGGLDNGPPGERPYGDEYYAAFVLDPDGHNIEAVHHGDRAG